MSLLATVATLDRPQVVIEPSKIHPNKLLLPEERNPHQKPSASDYSPPSFFFFFLYPVKLVDWCNDDERRGGSGYVYGYFHSQISLRLGVT